MKTPIERRNQLTQLDRQNWHLWAVALAITISLALAIAALFYPALSLGVDLIETHYNVLPQLILGLLTLVFLSLAYVIAKQRELNEMRNLIISSLADAVPQEGGLPKDLLTEVYDRRALTDILELERKRADRYRSALCLVLFDIRRFGEINTKEGNMVGDFVLKDLARTLKATVRQTDIVVRYGGDEFLCFLPGTEGKGGEIFVRRVAAACQQVNRLRGLVLDFGLAVYRMGEDIDAVMANAERELETKKSRPASQIDA